MTDSGTANVTGWSLKRRLTAGERLLNGWMSLSDPFVAEILASMGYASVTVDRQHGRPGPGGLWELALAIRSRGAAPVIRVSSVDDSQIGAALDAGFEGVVCPMIESAAAAERLVSQCRYPPAGARSFGPTRAALGFDSDFRSESDDNIVCLAMIETARSVDNLDEILAVDGLDGIYVGPADLAMSQGREPVLDSRVEEIVHQLGGLADAARRAGKTAGIHCGSVEYADLMASRGYQILTVGSDVRFIRAMSDRVTTEWSATLDPTPA